MQSEHGCTINTRLLSPILVPPLLALSYSHYVYMKLTYGWGLLLDRNLTTVVTVRCEEETITHENANYPLSWVKCQCRTACTRRAVIGVHTDGVKTTHMLIFNRKSGKPQHTR